MSVKSSSQSHCETRQVYLFAYNSVQMMGWIYLLLRTTVYFLDRGTLENYWNEVKWPLIVFQNAAALEVLHACLGLVHSGVLPTFIQVLTRVFSVCGVLLVSDDATTSPGVVLCVLAWSVAEIIRYSYYAINSIAQAPQTLLFLRYSAFYLLYPLGACGEHLCIYHSLNDVANRQFWAIPVLTDSFTIASQYHVKFSVLYYHFLIFYMFLCIPVLPMLYRHMIKQREKMLIKHFKSY